MIPIQFDCRARFGKNFFADIGLCFFLTLSLLCQGAPTEAQAQATKGIDVTDLKAGRAAFEAQQYDEALRAFYRFRDQRPNNLSVHFWLATTLATMGRNKEAVAEYVSCLDLAKSIGMDSAEMRHNLGNALIRGGYLKEPTFDFQRATIIDPKCPAPYLGLAKCLIESGNFDEAIVALKTYQRNGGQDINAILLHGLALAGKDDYIPAKQDLNDFISAAQNGGYSRPPDKDLTSFRTKYVTTGSVNPAAKELAARTLKYIQQRQSAARPTE
ncbi:MAG: tetratricopeptide repeat protein [Cyanobacteria bacterium SZAS LIN-2]|nr:tetratricopeptide repeat protein [Cyanobacteria bacterium SZAS LIN-2]